MDNNELRNLIGTSERVLFELKPDRKCFIFESIFNPLLPFAIVWGLFDFFFISNFVTGTEETNILYFLIPFFLLHLMPVWIYLGGVLFSVKRYHNTNYIVTDKAIYASTGVFTKKVYNKPFAEMSHIDLHRGLFDQKFGVGDIICTSAQRGENGASIVSINSISNYEEVYQRIKKIQQDIYTDVMYPNDKRPSENHGYNTEYKGDI